MKIKIKLTVEQFKYLFTLIDDLLHGRLMTLIELTRSQSMNLKMFLIDAVKRIADLHRSFVISKKVKTFSIEFNQLEAVTHVLQSLRYKDQLCPYSLALHEDLKRQTSQITCAGPLHTR